MTAVTSGGIMNSRVSIETQNVTVDSAGGPVETWTETSKRWACVQPLTGQERLIAQQMQAQVSHKIRMRWFAGLTAKDRIRLDGRVFSIQSVMDLYESHRELQVMALEVA